MCLMSSWLFLQTYSCALCGAACTGSPRRGGGHGGITLSVQLDSALCILHECIDMHMIVHDQLCCHVCCCKCLDNSVCWCMCSVDFCDTKIMQKKSMVQESNSLNVRNT